MSESEFLFYEDTKSQKRLIMIFAILFYAGIGAILLAFVIGIIIDSKTLLEQIEFGVSDILIFPFLVLMAIAFTLYAVMAKQFKYYITINEDEFAINTINNKGMLLIKYNVKDFKDYNLEQLTKKRAKYKLTFDADKKIVVTTNKQTELKIVLDSLLRSNKRKWENENG